MISQCLSGDTWLKKMIFGDITTGPSSDLQVATNLARAMVTRWGMSDLIGPIALGNDGGKLAWGKLEKKDIRKQFLLKLMRKFQGLLMMG